MALLGQDRLSRQSMCKFLGLQVVLQSSCRTTHTVWLLGHVCFNLSIIPGTFERFGLLLRDISATVLLYCNDAVRYSEVNFLGG